LIQEIEQQYLDHYFHFFRKKLYNISQLVIGGGCGDIVGSKNPKSKLTENDVKLIRSEFTVLSDELIRNKYEKLAKKYCVSTLTISRIIRNKSWKRV
jgi:hypothetical protein